MTRVLFLLFWWLPVSGMLPLVFLLFLLLPAPGRAGSTPLQLTLDSLQRGFTGYPLSPHPWQFRAGDDRRWASPTLNDREWMPYHTGFSRNDAPPGWKGIGWFRLHFTVDALPADSLLALRLAHVGASEIFVDGRKIGGFGQIGSSPTTGTDYLPYFQPVTFRLNRVGAHVLAVRLATYRQYSGAHRARWPQGFVSWMAPNERMTTYMVRLTRNNGLNLVCVFGPGLFALLHLFLFLFYPVRRSNLYYSIWLFFFITASACIYFNNVVTDPAWLQMLDDVFLIANVADGVASVVFIYSVCYAKPPRQVWGIYAAGAALVLAILLLSELNTPPFVFGFVLLCTAEIMRVVVRAMLRGQPGVWLIGIGLLAVASAIFIGANDVLGLWNTNPYGANLFITFNFLTLPLCTSLYLAQDFARTNLNLEAQLKQVEELSAQTREQEAEKLRLISRQNEQLEQTVHERTGQLQQQTDKLRELDAFKSRFFTNLTHEFRTPLTLILGPAEQLLAQTNDPQTKQQVGLIQRNGDRLLRLINQLLDLSKLEAGKMELTMTPGNLVSLVRGTLQSFESLAHQKGIALQFTADLERLAMAFDRDKLEKILYNLLANAIKFTPSGGKVLVTLTRDGSEEDSWVQLSVQDTGVGIPAAKQPYIFDRFYQADAPDQREQEGTGIGLALTKELVELHGGTIHLSSQEGIGTTVTVHLPLQSVPLQEVAAEPPGAIPSMVAIADLSPASPEPVDVPLVLLIEDNDDVRAFIRSSLDQQAGGEAYRILEAPNGEVGVQLAQQHVPDLVITDLMMPWMNGYQVCTTLKQDERTSHIPIIMLTARADLDSKLDGLETGVDVYLAKPFSQRELLAQLTNLIALRRQLRERYSGATFRRATLRGDTIAIPYPWQPAETALPSMEQVFLDRVRAAIEAHIADEQYSVDRLSDDVGLSRTQLHRKLKALTNDAPGDLIRLMRLQRAHELLSGHVGSVAEVAYQVGFGNPANFSTSFSRHFGYAPSEVKRGPN